MGIGAVKYNPQNPNSILIATGEGYCFDGEFTQGFGVYITYDGGETWNETMIVAEFDQLFAGMDIYWNPVDTNKVAIASSFGNYFSNDGGINYSYALDRIGGRMIADPSNPNRLYFTARYYTADYPGGLYISEDSGQSWELSGDGLPIPAEFGYTSISIHETYPNLVYLAVSQSVEEGTGPMKGIFKSVDYGETFTEVPSTQDIFCYPAPYDYICQGWYDNTILIDAADTNIIYAGGTRLSKSYNGGIDWDLIDRNEAGTEYVVHPDHHQTIFHPITGDLFDCHDGGVNYSDDGGDSWQNISNGLITHQFYSIAFAQTDPDVVIGGTQDVGTFTTTNAHSGIWQNPVLGDGFGHVIAHDNSSIWYATSYINYRRLKSTNSGELWFTINAGTVGDQWRMPMVMHPGNSDILLSADNSYMYRSDDAGMSWTAVAPVGPIRTFAFDKQNTDLVYACDLWGSNMYRTLDGGITWSYLEGAPPGPTTDIETDRAASGRVFITVGSYAADNQVYMSETAGASWENMSNNLPEAPANSIAISTFNPDEIYVGTDLGVWLSMDGGENYIAFNDGLPGAVVVEDLHFYTPDSTVRIGTYGRGYWRTGAYTKTLSEIPVQKEIEVNLYPNPSNGVYHLSREVESYRVYDQTGRLILNQNDLLIDLSDYENGVYFLVTEEQRFKLIKQ
ncbi:MAG: T9SS type A sorting domain-containing protein [Crocinitomicaceae bacterium]